MVTPYKLIEHHHGMDGFGDVSDLPKSKPKLEPENGILAIIRLAHEYSGKILPIRLSVYWVLSCQIRLGISVIILH